MLSYVSLLLYSVFLPITMSLYSFFTVILLSNKRRSMPTVLRLLLSCHVLLRLSSYTHSINHITYIFILVYRFEFVHILILRYSRSYRAKNFQRNLYFFNILLKCHYCSIYNKYNHILYICMHT